MTKTVEISPINSHIYALTLNRPEAMNSLNHTMAQELLDAVTELEANPEVRVIIFKGAGKQFMAGGDIKFFYEYLGKMAEHAPAIIDQVHQVTQKLMTMPKIIIASVHGAVAGIGLSFMLACDLVVAAQSTKFTTAYSKLAISPDGGATYHLPRIVGAKIAMELLLFSDLFGTEQAKNWGLINQITADDQLEQQTLQLAKRLEQGPPLTYQKIKHLVRASAEQDLIQQLQLEQRYFVDATQTQDFAAGVLSFIKKEPAEFTGR